MKVYTIGFTQKSAERFFSLIRDNGIQLLLDIRLSNKSQLAGFAKGEDLAYFLKELCGCGYRYCQEYAPTKELMDGYRNKQITWEQMVEGYTGLIEERGTLSQFQDICGTAGSVCLLCSEATPRHCHRGILVDLLSSRYSQLEINHL